MTLQFHSSVLLSFQKINDLMKFGENNQENERKERKIVVNCEDFSSNPFFINLFHAEISR